MHLQTNTFQVILITDGRFSFTLLSYGNIQWGGDWPSETYQVAFSGAEYYNSTNDGPIENIATLSNVGVPGLFIFRVDQPYVMMPNYNVSGK